MKTAEEAKKYAKKIIVLENRDKFSNEADLRTAEYWAYKAYLAGYNEAMRWRTFDEKPAIIHTWILVRPKLYPIFKPKVKRVDVFVDLSKKYTHWRPIE